MQKSSDLTNATWIIHRKIKWADTNLIYFECIELVNEVSLWILAKCAICVCVCAKEISELKK